MPHARSHIDRNLSQRLYHGSRDVPMATLSVN